MAGYKYEPKTRLSKFVNNIEENGIALILGLMTALTFVNVILRYVFNTAIIWSIEVTLVMFAWLVLFGIAYGFKVTSHLGVDAIVNLFKPRGQRVLGIISAVMCLIYAILLLKGAWDYWAPFADLPKTTGRFFPTGLDWDARRFGFQETGQIPIPFDGLKTWLEQTFNSYEQGGQILFDEYSKMPVLVPYLALPLAALLILYRVVQALVRVLRGEQSRLIVSHEAEEAVEDVAAMNKES